MIRLSRLTLRRGTRVLLDSVDLLLQPGEKIGLVGRNGAGKSSLFAALDGSLAEDGGEVFVPAGWRVAQVAQNLPETDEAATAFVLAGDTRLAAIAQRLHAAEAAGDGMLLAQAHADWADAGAHDANARAQALILGLGFHVAQLQQPVRSFSGGWRMRLQLARALMCPSDLLLLDEPTNHLDLDALIWLEGWLKRYAGTLLVISHDREFLDAVTHVTVHIDQARLNRYGGNYSQFELLHAQQLAQQQAAWARQQDKIAHLQQFIDRFRAKATKARQAQSRVKQIERMEKIAPVLAGADFHFTFARPAALPNPMLDIREATLGYCAADGQQKAVLHAVTCQVLAGQRIGILGANGQGKSTLVKAIAGQLRALAGKVTPGKGLRIGYFAQQEMDVLRPDDNPMQHLLRLARQESALHGAAGWREQDLRNHLGRFDFSGDSASQRVGSMSGGEKARLVLALMVWQRPNLLLLDEPTNHLDLVTRQALALALQDFDGALLLVSHDRALLRAVCEDFWLVSGGQLAAFDGDLDDYQRHVLDAARRARAAPAAIQTGKTSKEAPAPDAREQRRQSAQARQRLAAHIRPLKQEMEHIGQRLEALQAERDALHAQLGRSGQGGEAIAAAGRSLKACTQAIEDAEERWLALGEEIEQIEAGAPQ